MVREAFPMTAGMLSKRHRHRTGKMVLAVAFLVGVAAWGGDAQAQINPFRGNHGPKLAKEDIGARSAAALKLLNQHPAKVGETESWVGPKSGNQGTLTIRRVYQRSGMPCRAVNSQVLFKRQQSKRDFTMNVCRVSTGQWKLAE
jgi:surface antigen